MSQVYCPKCKRLTKHKNLAHTKKKGIIHTKVECDNCKNIGYIRGRFELDT